MPKISLNFNREEFACHCGCGSDNINMALISALEIIRKKVGKPITVNCGMRCAKHNAVVGGVKNSQHLLGLAADIKVQGMTPRQLHYIIECLHNSGATHIGGLGLYNTFVHVDVRAGTARWCG